MSYSEYDSVRRLGIGDAKSFIQKRFKGEPILYLSSCCAGKSLQEQVEASVEESLLQGSWIDIMVRAWPHYIQLSNTGCEGDLFI